MFFVIVWCKIWSITICNKWWHWKTKNGCMWFIITSVCLQDSVAVAKTYCSCNCTLYIWLGVHVVPFRIPPKFYEIRTMCCFDNLFYQFIYLKKYKTYTCSLYKWSECTRTSCSRGVGWGSTLVFVSFLYMLVVHVYFLFNQK